MCVRSSRVRRVCRCDIGTFSKRRLLSSCCISARCEQGSSAGAMRCVQRGGSAIGCDHAIATVANLMPYVSCLIKPIHRCKPSVYPWHAEGYCHGNNPLRRYIHRPAAFRGKQASSCVPDRHQLWPRTASGRLSYYASSEGRYRLCAQAGSTTLLAMLLYRGFCLDVLPTCVYLCVQKLDWASAHSDCGFNLSKLVHTVHSISGNLIPRSQPRGSAPTAESYAAL